MDWSELSDPTRIELMWERVAWWADMRRCSRFRWEGRRERLAVFFWFRMGLWRESVAAWGADSRRREGPRDWIGFFSRVAIGRVAIGLRWRLWCRREGHGVEVGWSRWGVINSVALSNAWTFLAHRKIPYQCIIVSDGARSPKNEYMPSPWLPRCPGQMPQLYCSSEHQAINANNQHLAIQIERLNEIRTSSVGPSWSSILAASESWTMEGDTDRRPKLRGGSSLQSPTYSCRNPPESGWFREFRGMEF